jgi:palmitoyl-protein thioesterase
MEFDKQAQIACNNLMADSNLVGPISVIGLSQGSLLARYISESCPFNGDVKRMVTIGGPHMGVANVPNCHKGIICNGINFIAKSFVYYRFFQAHIGPAGYFRNPKNLSKYLNKSVFLPDLNNERNFNIVKKERFLKLEKLMLIMFDQDTMIDPKETAWFGFYAEDG